MNGKNILKKAQAFMLACTLLSTTAVSSFALNVDKMELGNELTHLGSYSTGYSDPDGGVAEIITYNSNNSKFYLVNGKQQNIEIVSLKDLQAGKENQSFNDKKTIDVKTIAKEKFGFDVADITSISVDTINNRIAVSLQAQAYDQNGYVVILDAEGNYIENFEVGVQPDMVKFSPDGNFVLTADEGEPRMGFVSNDDGTINYEETVKAGLVDPMGSVTVIDMNAKTSKKADFTAFDEQRENLTKAGVLVKKGLMPSTDFEPEYITMVDSKTAYVVLQEANSIATVDVESGKITAVNPLGFKDHMAEGNELDANKKDHKAVIQAEPLKGVYMPDGISSFEKDGKTYILTANEGDGSEWGKKTDYEYCNEDEVKLYYTDEKGEEASYKIDVLSMDKMDGLPSIEGTEYKGYSFGARSFTIFEVTENGSLSKTYDSASDFERITAKLYPENFNANNDGNGIDSRSDNKGPEPENVTVMEVEGRTLAYIGLERVSGVMVYDITDPSNSSFADYINTRNFDVDFDTEYDAEEDEDVVIGVKAEQGDIAPEGICAITAENSPTGYPLLLTGNEVSGTVAVFEQYSSEAFVKPDTDTDTDTDVEPDTDVEEDKDPETSVDPNTDTKPEQDKDDNVDNATATSPATGDYNYSLIMFAVLGAMFIVMEILTALRRKEEN